MTDDVGERRIDRWVWTMLAVLQTLLAIAGFVERAHPVPLFFFVAAAVALIIQASRSWRA